jgi:hypothetical protein
MPSPALPADRAEEAPNDHLPDEQRQHSERDLADAFDQRD